LKSPIALPRIRVLQQARRFLQWLRAHWRRAFVLTAVLALGAVAGAVLFAWSGLYNVAASRGHWWVTDVFLRFAMESSVRTHAPDVEPPRLDDADLVLLGAGHYHSGCAYCHGAPGDPINPVAAEMLPSPPDLSERSPQWSDTQLFWLVKHGLKYAGMPAWPAQDRDDEVWAVVAFLRTLPDLDENGYAELVHGSATGGAAPDAAALAAASPNEVQSCVRCHGDAEAPRSALVPRIQGQPNEVLARALRDYASGRRHSGVMQQLAADLKPSEIDALAAYYAGLPRVAAQDIPRPEADLDAGRRLAEEGQKSAGLPSCLSCHGNDGLPIFPRLLGQNARYMEEQLRAWKRGGKGTSDADRLMGNIAQRLSDEQIRDVSAWLAAQPVDGAR
jgi:cytochrome c553